MLHLIFGMAGAGKTTLLHERIADCVSGGGRAILLVPEQYSFESEKALYRRLGARGALQVEVLSFTRLCDRIFREYGGLAGVHLEEAAKYLLMSVALGEVGGALKIYGKNAANAAFAASMCEQISELKTAGASPEALRGAAQDLGGAFGDKLSDIALIFDAYQAVIERGYSDPDDCLARACKRLEGRNFFAGYDVFIDGFMAFMGAEWKLLKFVLTDSPHVWAALTCMGLWQGDGTGALACAAHTAARLVRAAREAGAAVAAPVLLETPRRFVPGALAWIAQAYPQETPAPYDGAPDGVQIAACEDVYDEIEYIAGEICALVREKGYRYRDIALIGRALEPYLVPLETVFARYDIPYFADRRVDIQVHPLVNGIFCALDAVRGRFDSEAVLALAKTCISGIDAVEAGLLENYCFTWGVSGTAWAAPFVNHPDGMEGAFSDEQRERLSRINAARAALIGPLERLADSLRGCDGRGFARAIYSYLEQVDAACRLRDYAEGMEEGDARRFLDLSAQVWDAVIGLLDVFGGALAGISLPLARLTDLLRLGVSTVDIGSLPQTIDQVIAGTADRIRPNAPRAVFVIGLNEGVFPLWSSPSGIFSAAERERLRTQGVDLLRTPEQTALFERYYVYFALTQASEALWLTYPLRDAAGAARTASSAVDEVRALVGAPARGSAGGALARAAGERSAFDAMMRHWRDDTPETAVLRSYFTEQDPARIRTLEALGAPRAFSLEGRGAARALFGTRMRISPSRAELYYECPFSYFCRVGLRLRPRRRAEFNPIESGSLIHLVLEKIVKKYGGRGLAQLNGELLRSEITAIIDADLKARIANYDEMPARFKYLFRRLVGTIQRLIERLALEFGQSAFEPAAFELPIGLDAPVQPLDLRAPDGTRVIVEGIVDRVDVLEQDGKKYVRVVDYKSGAKTFSLSDICYGLNMQMLIYLFSICEADGAVPAGVLYMPARDSVIQAERNASGEEIQAQRLKRLRMNGILLEDRSVLSAMEPNLAGVFIPVKTKKDGSFDARSSLASLEQMGLIQREVERHLIGIAQGLADGKIGAEPVEGLSNYRPCDWCDYHAVCGHEDGDAVRRLAELDRAEAMKRMEEGMGDG